MQKPIITPLFSAEKPMRAKLNQFHQIDLHQQSWNVALLNTILVTLGYKYAAPKEGNEKKITSLGRFYYNNEVTPQQRTTI